VSSSASPQDAEQKVLFRITLPNLWEESLTWLIAEHGFGSAIGESSYPLGAVDTEIDAPGLETELRVLLELDQADAFRDALQLWMADLGVSAADWSFQEQQHGLEEHFQISDWQAQWKPFRCGHFVVHADFQPLEELPTKAGDIPLQLKTGSAFGTGTHPTTRLALKTLQKWCAGGPPPRLLDVGTGSGILAVAAALGGVREVIGMDPDPFSAVQANAMAEINGVSSQCNFWRGGFESAAGQWPAVLANLVADILQLGAGNLADLVAPGGNLFAGGILRRHWQTTAEAMAAQGLVLESCIGRGRWLAGIWTKA
jgi:ribosomal protein L11 methyltransferase